MNEPEKNLALAKRYLRAIESGAGGDEIANFFHPEAVVEIYPSLYFPHATKSELAGIRASADRGRQVMTNQKYEIKNELTSGDQVVFEVDWTGILAVPFQTIPKGGQMRAHFAMFMQFREGKIVAQRNYDCYEAS
jgi:ketosteroid isomerase-like protein